MGFKGFRNSWWIVLLGSLKSATIVAVVASVVGTSPASAVTIGVDAVHGFASSNLATGALFDTFRGVITGGGQ